MLSVAADAVDNGYAENIKSFESTYVINQDSSIDVTEDITYDFGDNQKHGIERQIQTTFSDKKAAISNVFAINENTGDYLNASVSQSDKYTVIRIGNSDTLVTGIHEYKIRYQLVGAFNYFSDKDEFYWQVTGTGWEVPIANASAIVDFANLGVDNATAYYCYAGTSSSQNACQKASLSTDKTYTFSQVQLASQNGLTIALAFAPGSVEKTIIPLTFGEKYGFYMTIGVEIFLLLIFIASVLYTNRYALKKGTIVPLYDPPEGMTPIETGFVLDTKADARDISAELIYFAVNGYLKITKIDSKSIFGKHSDYELTKLKEMLPDETKPYDSEIFEAIFQFGNTVKISELQARSGASTLSGQGASLIQIPRDIRNFFAEKGFVSKHAQATTMSVLVLIFIAFALVTMLGGAGIIPGLTFLGSYKLALIGSYFLLFGGIFFSGLMMKPLTKAGAELRDQALGLKMYIKTAEIDRIKFHNAPEKTPEQFEKLLPYAMVFGLEKEWAKQFEGIYTQNPSWYFDPSGTVFAPALFTDSLKSFSSSVGSSFSSSSSGSSGGGSVGGGGGGGGGGSW